MGFHDIDSSRTGFALAWVGGTVNRTFHPVAVLRPAAPITSGREPLIAKDGEPPLAKKDLEWWEGSRYIRIVIETTDFTKAQNPMDTLFTFLAVAVIALLFTRRYLKSLLPPPNSRPSNANSVDGLPGDPA
jgi:hypothetical protein